MNAAVKANSGSTSQATQGCSASITRRSTPSSPGRRAAIGTVMAAAKPAMEVFTPELSVKPQTTTRPTR